MHCGGRNLGIDRAVAERLGDEGGKVLEVGRDESAGRDVVGKSGKEKVEGTIGKPEDIASAICYLASQEARFINGTTLVADGGRLAIL